MYHSKANKWRKYILYVRKNNIQKTKQKHTHATQKTINPALIDL